MTPEPKNRLRKFGYVVAVLVFLGLGCVVFGWFYVRAHPLVFNESFFEHEHCMKQTTMALITYAHEHYGRFPSHTNGYADALMLMSSEESFLFTGPGYDIAPVVAAWKAGQDVPEAELGRVYVQGLREGDNGDIAIVFDKLPTPGGDHCHGLARVWAPLVREVGLLNGSMERILEKNWPKFSRDQIELLVKAGIPRPQAEAYYTEQAKPELMALLKRNQR